MHGAIPSLPFMPSHINAKLRTTTFLLYFATVLRIKRVLNLAFTTFHYKLYDILDQDLLEIY
jgi:hypothetical protein